MHHLMYQVEFEWLLTDLYVDLMFKCLYARAI